MRMSIGGTRHRRPLNYFRRPHGPRTCPSSVSNASAELHSARSQWRQRRHTAQPAIKPFPFIDFGTGERKDRKSSKAIWNIPARNIFAFVFSLVNKMRNFSSHFRRHAVPLLKYRSNNFTLNLLAWALKYGVGEKKMVIFTDERKHKSSAPVVHRQTHTHTGQWIMSAWLTRLNNHTHTYTHAQCKNRNQFSMLNRENAAPKLKQEHGGDRIRVEDAIIAWHP